MKILTSVIMYVFDDIGTVIRTMVDILLLLAIVFAILVWIPDASFNSDLLSDLQNSLEIVYLKLQLAAHRYLR